MSWADYWRERGSQVVSLDEARSLVMGDHAQNEKNPPSYPDLMDWLDPVLGLRAGMRILDMGCGDGYSLGHLGGALELFGADLSRGLLRQASVRLAHDVRVRGLVECDIGRLPYRDCKFDRVICAGVLQFLAGEEDVVLALGELGRVTKRGGMVAVVFRNTFGPMFGPLNLHKKLSGRSPRPLVISPFSFRRSIPAGLVVRREIGSGFHPLLEHRLPRSLRESLFVTTRRLPFRIFANHYWVFMEKS